MMNRRIFKDETSETGEIPFYKIGTFGSTPDAYITREKFDKYKAKYPYPKIGDILLAASGATIGKTIEFDGEDSYFQDSNIVWLEHDERLTASFLKQFYSLVSWRGLEGTAVPRLYNKIILETDISIPSPNEQVAIGNLFRIFDTALTLHKRKLMKLKELKRGYLQMMFPQCGENVPRLRFKGFTDTWQEQRLGDLGETYTGLSGKTKDDFGHGGAEFVIYKNVFANTFSDIHQTEPIGIDTTQNEVKYGDLLFTTSSETPEEVGMASVWLDDRPNVYLNSFCFGYRPQNALDPYFSAFLLRSPKVRENFVLLAQGISRYNISKTKAMDMTVFLPSHDEQKKIGSFFRTLDTQITAHAQKLEQLKKLKSAYLQKMFI